MIQSLFLLPLIFLASFAQAESPRELTVEDFQSLELFEYVQIQSVERVFSDSVVGEDVYHVRYLTANYVAPSDQGDDQAGEMALLCEYILVDTSQAHEDIFEVYDTGITCDQDIEEVIGDPSLIEEN